MFSCLFTDGILYAVEICFFHTVMNALASKLQNALDFTKKAAGGFFLLIQIKVVLVFLFVEIVWHYGITPPM